MPLTSSTGVHALRENHLLYWLQASSPRPSRTGRWGVHWFLEIEGKTLAYCKTVGDLDGLPTEVQDIEVRLSHRGQGLSRAILDAITLAAGPLTTQGHHTPAGARALAHLPLAPGCEESLYPHEVTFVKDWNSRELRYP